MRFASCDCSDVNEPRVAMYGLPSQKYSTPNDPSSLSYAYHPEPINNTGQAGSPSVGAPHTIKGQACSDHKRLIDRHNDRARLSKIEELSKRTSHHTAVGVEDQAAARDGGVIPFAVELAVLRVANNSGPSRMQAMSQPQPHMHRW